LSVPSAADRRRLVVATYNVHRCVGVDGREDCARVADVIRELDADIVGLQEVVSVPDTGAAALYHNQLGEIAERLGYEAIPGPAFMHANRKCGNALLSRLPVLGVHRLEIAVAGREPRNVLEVTLGYNARIVRALVTHFGLLGRERRLQADMLLGILAERPCEPTIVVGDFNEWMPRGRSLQRLDRALGASVALRTFPAWMPALALDRVWVHPRHALESIRAHTSTLARRASDHLPVRAVVAI